LSTFVNSGLKLDTGEMDASVFLRKSTFQKDLQTGEMVDTVDLFGSLLQRKHPVFVTLPLDTRAFEATTGRAI
jgi:hypothetical protein